MTGAWRQAQLTARKLAPAPHLTVSVAQNKELRLLRMHSAAGTTGLVYQGWQMFRPYKRQLVKVSIACGQWWPASSGLSQ